MRIAQIAGEYPPLQGGLGDYTHELSRAFVNLGHDVHVLTKNSPVKPTDEDLDNALSSSLRCRPPPTTSTDGRVVFPSFSFRVAKTLL